MDKKQADKLAKQIVDKSPKLKAIKSRAHGEKSLFHGSGMGSDGGKGSAPRPGTFSQEYKDNFDKIDFSNKPKRNYKLKINGVYQDDEDE